MGNSVRAVEGPETVRIVPGRDSHGQDIFAFLVKRSYRFDAQGECHRITPDEPFVDVDSYWGEPGASSPRSEADIAPYKPATDIVVIGKVHSPQGAPVACTEASIEVGDARKTIVVFGDRVAMLQGNGKTPRYSEPAAFTELPLLYERAYGGTDTTGELEFAYPRNPVGCGLVLRDQAGRMVQMPNFEDPDDLLTPERLILGDVKRWNRQPLPQGLGWFSKTWYPRMSFVGVIPGFVDADEIMPEEALGLVPRNQIALGRQFRLPSFDVRFNNGASPGLALPLLAGTEAVRLLHLSKDGDVRFRLPGDRPTIVADIGEGESAPEAVLHSVVIEPDHRRVDLVWRSSVAYPGAAWLPHMRRLAGWVA
jgi:hypothetical protein